MSAIFTRPQNLYWVTKYTVGGEKSSSSNASTRCNLKGQNVQVSLGNVAGNNSTLHDEVHIIRFKAEPKSVCDALLCLAYSGQRFVIETIDLVNVRFDTNDAPNNLKVVPMVGEEWFSYNSVTDDTATDLFNGEIKIIGNRI